MKDIIEKEFDSKDLSPQAVEAVLEAIEALDKGQLRVCEKTTDGWIVNEWAKKAVLMYFRIQKMTSIEAGDLSFFDKIPLKKWTAEDGVRVVPHALVRRGSHVAPGAVLMPSYVNIGAFVDSGTLVDTWATVGSCGQIGKNVHLSGGVGIGGVLEPLQAKPVIIEDDAFIGSRSIIVEGVHIGEGAVIGAGVTITGSSKIIDVTGSTEKIIQGHVPARSVVIPGSLMKEFPSGSYGVNCALIIGQRKESTDKKTSLNQVLRDFNVTV